MKQLPDWICGVAGKTQLQSLCHVPCSGLTDNQISSPPSHPEHKPSSTTFSISSWAELQLSSSGDFNLRETVNKAKRSFAALLYTQDPWKDKTHSSDGCPAKQTPSSPQPGAIFNLAAHGKFALPFYRLKHSYLSIWAHKDVVRFGRGVPKSNQRWCQWPLSLKVNLDGVPSWRPLSSLPPKQSLSSFGATGSSSSSAEDTAAPSWTHTCAQVAGLHAASVKVSTACKKACKGPDSRGVLTLPFINDS